MKLNQFLKILIPSVLWISFLVIIWIDFVPFKINELWNGAGKKFEDIIITLCSSYIASYIFYFLMVYLKEKNDRTRKRKEFNTLISIYLNNYQIQLKELLSRKDDIIFKTENKKNYELPLESLIHIFEPTTQFSFYTHYSDDETKSFLQNRTKKYRNYFFALRKLLKCVKQNLHLLDFYEDNEVYELFNIFIILNEKENLEEQLDQRANTKLESSNQYLFEKDIEHIIYFTNRIKNEPEYANHLELNSKEYLTLYYSFKYHLELNISLLRRYKRQSND